jgi:arabinose-5-phosphate isomerase
VTSGSSSDPAAFLRVEAAAIAAIAERVDRGAFEKATALLLGCAGKVIVTGAGTSGILARKLAATLTSTGTPAVHLHPSDALHGGLGIVGGDDVVIAFSNSGETAEVLAMIPYLGHRRVRLVAIVGGLGSSLARAADVVLEAAVDREACPLDLTPTASAAVALAVGDALAMTVMEARGFTAEGFARNHPSGRLGKRLTLRVTDVMVAGGPPAVEPVLPFQSVVAATSAGGLGAVAVCVGDGALVGIITDGDLRRSVARTASADLDGLTASQMMTPNPVTTRPTALAFEALQQMELRENQIAVLPVVDEHGTYLGMVRLHDLVRSGIA